MTEPAGCDLLFVVHRLTPPDRLVAVARARAARRITLLTTHHLFRHERAALAAALTPAVITFRTFAEFLSDTALADLDDATSVSLRPARPARCAYTDIFQHRMTRRKNAAVHTALLATGPVDQIYAAHGLGIDGPYWRRHGATLLESPPWLAPLRRTALWHQIHAWRTPLPATATLIHDGPIGYLFPGGLRRLRLRPGTALTTLPLRAALGEPSVRFIGTTIHDDPAAAHRLGFPVRVFVDGYLPTNYPRTYLDALGDSEFVCPDPFSTRWLSRHGCRTLPAPAFIDSGKFSPAVTPPSLRTIVCLLNHTGDWSALIHRSDTDLLAEAFANLAVAHPAQHFVLRPHPGMDHPRHEGSGALDRLAALVRATAAPNLEFSRGPLADDLTRGDLFVSEYSATLLDVWRAGKLGLVVNLTGRRSFMQDFSDLGFPCVSTAAAILPAVADPAAFAARQSAAAAAYNTLLAP